MHLCRFVTVSLCVATTMKKDAEASVLLVFQGSGDRAESRTLMSLADQLRGKVAVVLFVFKS